MMKEQYGDPIDIYSSSLAGINCSFSLVNEKGKNKKKVEICYLLVFYSSNVALALK